MYTKKFDEWNKVKKNLQTSVNGPVIFKERDVWWCSLGVNIGDEEDGKNQLFERPVLVLKKFNSKFALVLPMSTKMKANPYYFLLENESVLLSQIRPVSVLRFNRFIKRLSTYEAFEITWRFIDLLLLR